MLRWNNMSTKILTNASSIYCISVAVPNKKLFIPCICIGIGSVGPSQLAQPLEPLCALDYAKALQTALIVTLESV
jgi:hypothetical protein